MNSGSSFRVFSTVHTIKLLQLWKCAVFLQRSFIHRVCCLLRQRLHALHGEDICHVGLFFERTCSFFFQKMSMRRLHVIGDDSGGEEVWWSTGSTHITGPPTCIQRNARNPTDMYIYSTSFFAYSFPWGVCQVRVSTSLAPSNGKVPASQKRVHLTIPSHVLHIVEEQLLGDDTLAE